MYMDVDYWNLTKYIYLRRLNLAWNHCSEGFLLSPARMMCALAYTSPRSNKLMPSEEKAIFKAALVLWYGFERG